MRRKKLSMFALLQIGRTVNYVFVYKQKLLIPFSVEFCLELTKADFYVFACYRHFAQTVDALSTLRAKCWNSTDT